MILAETGHQNQVGPERLVKVACYLVEDLPWYETRGPNSTAVDWLVLLGPDNTNSLKRIRKYLGTHAAVKKKLFISRSS